MDLRVRSGVVAPGANPPDPAAVSRPLPHSSVSLARRKTPLICRLTSVWSERFLSVNDTEGTSLFLPSTMPASTHPVETIWSCRPFVRSTVGPQPESRRADAKLRTRRSRACARMRAILEHPHLNPLHGFLPRNLPGKEGRPIRALQTNNERAGIAV